MRRINYKKKCIVSISLTALLFNVVMLTGCESQQAREMRLAKEKAEEEKREKEYLEMFYREDAVLLAHKYKVDEEKVFNILITENDLVYSELSPDDIFSGEELKKRIYNYSKRYDIPSDIIASILIDYKAMQSGYSE